MSECGKGEDQDREPCYLYSKGKMICSREKGEDEDGEPSYVYRRRENYVWA